MMLWHHLFLYAPEYGTLTHQLAQLFKICVALFLFVSGYGLTIQYERRDVSNIKSAILFIIKRFINFFLPYWFCFIVVFTIGNLCGYTATEAYPETRNTLKCILLDVCGQMGYSSYLSTWWFNKMIIQLYLLFPLLYLLSKSKIVAIISTVLFLILQISPAVQYGPFCVVEGGIPSFFLGMVFAKHNLIPTIKTLRNKVLLSLTLILFCTGLAIIHQSSNILPYMAINIRAISATIIVCIVALNPWIFKSQSLVYVGSISSIMYLTHTLFQKIIPNILYAPQNPLLIFGLFTTITISFSISVKYLMKATKITKLSQYSQSFLQKIA